MKSFRQKKILEFCDPSQIETLLVHTKIHLCAVRLSNGFKEHKLIQYIENVSKIRVERMFTV